GFSYPAGQGYLDPRPVDSDFHNHLRGHWLDGHRSRYSGVNRYVRLAPDARVDRIFSAHHDTHERYWFPVSNSRFHLGARHRDCVMRALGAGALWPLRQASRRCLALDACISNALYLNVLVLIVLETAGTQTTGANPVRAVVPDSEGRCTNRFSFYQHCCGAQISPRPGFFHLVD